MAAMAAGNVAGMAFAGLVRIDGPARLVCGLSALFTMAAATFLMGVAESPYILLAANAVNGVFMGIMTVAFTTLMQATTPDELRGRVMSVMMTVIGGTVRWPWASPGCSPMPWTRTCPCCSWPLAH